VNGDDICLLKKLLLRHENRVYRRRAFSSEVLTPSDKIHAEGLADPSNGTADIAEAKKAQCPAVEVFADRLLPTAAANSCGFHYEMARIREDQRPGQLDRGR
jgi:hypothetical protein